MIFYGVQGAEAAAELLRQGRDGEAACTGSNRRLTQPYN